MATITAADLARMRLDIGDTAATPALTDAEVDDCYVRFNEDFDRARICCIKQILASAAKLTAYSGAGIRVQRQQVWDHLKELLKVYEGDTATEVAITGTRKAPYKGRLVPKSGGKVAQ